MVDDLLIYIYDSCCDEMRLDVLRDGQLVCLCFFFYLFAPLIITLTLPMFVMHKIQVTSALTEVNQK